MIVPVSSYRNMDPGGSPTTERLVINAHQYEETGWNGYHIDKGYGWYGLFKA